MASGGQTSTEWLETALFTAMAVNPHPPYLKGWLENPVSTLLAESHTSGIPARGVSERGSILATTNLPFDEWTEVFGSERLTGALLERLTHHVHILEMNGESYRLKRSRENAASQAPDDREEE